MTRHKKSKHIEHRLLIARKERARLEIRRRILGNATQSLARQQLWAMKEVRFYTRLQVQLAA